MGRGKGGVNRITENGHERCIGKKKSFASELDAGAVVDASCGGVVRVGGAFSGVDSDEMGGVRGGVDVS